MVAVNVCRMVCRMIAVKVLQSDLLRFQSKLDAFLRVATIVSTL